jgi:hypothetical protein
VRRAALVSAVIAAGVGASARPARAGGAGEGLAPRSIGRAGAGTVSDDGAGAILTSPAALARRDSKRASAGVTIADDDLDHAPARDGAPEARAQDEPLLQPFAAAIAPVGPIVLGVALAVDRTGRSFATPDPQLSLDSVDRFFAYRYAGFSARLERRTIGLAAAARVSDWLAVGAGATVAMVRIEEHRRLWAGFTSRLLTPGDPAYDLDVAVEGDDDLVPGAVFGVFVAPPQLPLELAGSVAWSNQAHVRGGVDAEPQVMTNLAVRTPGAAPVAALDLPADLVIRAGARWLGDRWTAELGFEAARPRDDAQPVWRITGVEVVDVLTDQSRPFALTSRFAPRDRYAARAAVDVELLGGFLWVTAGYAWRRAGTADDRLAPTTADLGGHTAAVGLEVVAGGFTATLGWSRTFTAARTVTASALGFDDPFDPITDPTGLGRYDGTRDVIGFSLELSDE